ncbi:AraC family transcriptional regulator [Nonomuraea pusilla]|uniref:helix-turn-helix domain-containing protein n=1 Tax=Nonomuraea pusilla TaxID=46177 RepID=UPI0033221981
MRSSVRLGTGPGFTLSQVTCVDDHRGWSPAETAAGYRLVLVRRGRFRRLVRGRPAVVDATAAYLGLPGEEERFAHPAGGDLCTALSLSPSLWRTLAGDGTRPSRPTVYVDARLDLAHRRVLAAARAGDPAYELTESLLPLLATVLGRLTDSPTPATSPTGAHASGLEGDVAGGPSRGRGGREGGRPPGAPSRRAARPPSGGSPAGLVDAAREAIADDHPAAGALLSLAALLEVSPYRLSRAFTRELGVSLTHYRNRVRVGRALDRLEAGEPNLAVLAADLGFADQAHLTRTVRRHVGHTPAALRRLLT